jgi:hypothetical protein
MEKIAPVDPGDFDTETLIEPERFAGEAPKTHNRG